MEVDAVTAIGLQLGVDGGRSRECLGVPLDLFGVRDPQCVELGLPVEDGNQYA